MNASMILTNLGLADNENVIGLIKENKPLKFLVSSDKINAFYKLISAHNEDFTIQDRRRIVSAFGALFKHPHFGFYRNFMGKLVSKSSSPLAMMYAPDYSLQVGNDIPVMRSQIIKSALQLQKYANHHIKLLGESESIYEISLLPSTSGSVMNLKLTTYVPEDVTIFEDVENFTLQGKSDLINTVHKINSGKKLDDSEERLYNAISKQKLQRVEHNIDVQPIDFDAPSFPQDVLNIMRRYDEMFDTTIGARAKSVIMENTSLFVSRIIAALGAEPQLLFHMLGDKYVVNDYSKLAPLVAHVMSQMSVINSKFFK